MKLLHLSFTVIFTLLIGLNGYPQNLLINEFLASNLNTICDEYDEYDDWIEIYNSSDQPIDLADYYLTDDLGELRKWKIPAGYADSTTIAAYGFLILWADGQPEQGPLHANFKLSRSGEEIALVDKNGTTKIDAVRFNEQTTNVSYGRYNTLWMFYDLPTPRETNPPGFWSVVKSPYFSEDAGIFSGSKIISIFNNISFINNPFIILYFS